LAAIVHAGGLRDDRVALPGATHEVEPDAFAGGPADCLIGEGAAAPSQDDHAQTVDARRVKGLGAGRGSHAQRAAPNLKGGSIFGEKKKVRSHPLTLTYLPII
jgi:hypothetical protein